MGEETRSVDIFKTCTLCGRSWSDLREFVIDPKLQVDGYQACFVKPELGLVLVTDRDGDCGTTLAVQATELKALYHGPVHTERRTRQECCAGYCLRHNTVEECDADCDMAWVRTVLQWLHRHELPPHME